MLRRCVVGLARGAALGAIMVIATLGAARVSVAQSSLPSSTALAGCGQVGYTENGILFSQAPTVQTCDSPTSNGNQGRSKAVQQANESMQAKILGNALAGFGPGIFPTGRLAITHHSGEQGKINPTFQGPAYDIAEASVVGNAELTLLKQQNSSFRLGFYAGYSHADVSYAFNQADGSNDSGLLGGYGLYTFGQSYLMLMLSGDLGESDYTLRDIQVKGNYQTQGFLTSLTAGHVLTVGPNWFLDVRGVLGFGHHEGESHTANALNANTASFRVGQSEHEVFYGSTFLTLYTIVNSGGMVLQPYVRAGIKGEFDERNTLKLPAQTATSANGQNSATIGDVAVSFTDADFYGNAEIGLNAQLDQNWEAGAAGYWWGSADERTFGGRLGLKYKFN